MAFDPNSIPKELRQLNVVRTVPEEAHITPGTTSGRSNEGFYVNQPRDAGSPGSVSVVYYPAMVQDGGFAGPGSSNVVAARGVAGWIPHVAPPVPPPPVYVSTGLVDSGSVFSPTPSVGTRSNASHQASDEGGDHSVLGTKVKFLCSFGGKILPRPSDGVLRYVGGQTRIISVRRDVSFNELVQKMVDIYGESVVIKYQLPEEDLDALVSVSCPEDLDNMMDEYEKLVERFLDGSAKLRVFLFSPSEADLASLVQFSDMQNSGQKYFEAVNGISDGFGGGGITRRGSTPSAASDFSGADGQGEVNGLPSTGGLSPKENSVASLEATPRTVCVDQSPAIHIDTSSTPLGIPVAMSGPLPAVPAQLEHEVERAPPVLTPQQLGYDMQQPGMSFPATSPHWQAYVDPHQETSNYADYAQHPSQMGFPTQLLGTVSPGLPHQHVAAAGTPQQFIPAIHMAMPSSSHVSMNPNMVPAYIQPQQVRVEHFPGENTYGQRVVHFPVNQAYNSYQAQVPPAFIGGAYGWRQVPQQEQAASSEGRLPNQQQVAPEKIPIYEDCNLCQKALPHAHSDTVAQGQKENLASNLSDPKLVHYSLQLDDRGRPMNRTVVNGDQGEGKVEQHRVEVRPQAHMEPVAENMQDLIGVPQKDEGHYSGDRFVLREGDNSEQPKVTGPQGVIGLTSAVQSPFGIHVGTVTRPYQDNAVQPGVVPMQYQVRQGAMMDMPTSRDLLTVGGTPLQTSDYRLYESQRGHSDNIPAMVPKVNNQEFTAAYDYMRQIDGRMENLLIHPAEVSANQEQRPIENLKREDILEYKQPMVGEREAYLGPGIANAHKIHNANSIKQNEMLPSSANDSSYLHDLRPVEPFEVRAQAPVFGNSDNGPFQSKIVPSDVGVVPSDGNAASSQSPSYMVGDAQDGSNSLFSKQDPWSIQQETHFPPPRPKQIQLRKEALDTRDQSGNRCLTNSGEIPTSNSGEFTTEARLEDKVHQTSGNLNADFNSDHTQSSKGSAEEVIKQELKAVAEGVAASVLLPSVPFNPDLSAHGKSKSTLTSQENSEVQNTDVDIENKNQSEDMVTKLSDKISIGSPLSEGIGRLQIIKNSDLEELRELGSGTFGTVYHGKWRGTDVAIKRINERCFAGKPSEQDRMRDDFWNEAINLADLHHPNVVAFYGVVLDGLGGSVATVTEYMVNGSLRTALQKSERNLDKRKRLLIAMDVAFGMEYLHGKKIVHFDLKSDNLLVNLRDPHRPICKVGDLGLSKVKCQTLISGGVRGTLPWMAPELLNGSSSLVSEKVDVYSFGIVLWEILTGEEPYADLHYGAIIGGIVSNTLRPPIPESCDPEWRSLTERCWSSEPSERPNFTEIVHELRAMASKLPAKGHT